MPVPAWWFDVVLTLVPGALPHRQPGHVLATMWLKDVYGQLLEPLVHRQLADGWVQRASAFWAW
jgi:hypothetical protein